MNRGENNFRRYDKSYPNEFVREPTNWKNPDKHTTISVRLGTLPGKRVCTYHGSNGNWFCDRFKRVGTKKPATPKPVGG